MQNRIVLITVIYRNYNILDDFISSLKLQLQDNYCKVFIIDLTEKERRKKLQLPSFADIVYGKNEGYAYGVNLGIKKAIQQGYTSFVVVNSDVIFSKKFCNSVDLSISKNKDTIIGGKIYYAPGFEFHKTRYRQKDKGNVIWFAGGKIDWNNVITKHIGVDEIDSGQFNKIRNVDFITGCLIIFDKKIVEKVGMWNEKYFLYYEDADFCVRAKRKGIKLLYDPSIVIYHKNAQSTSGSGSEIHKYYQEKNRLRFGLKYAPLKTKLHLLKNYFIKKVY